MSRYIDADKLILSMRECAGYERNKHTTTTWIYACESFIDEIEDMLVDNKEDVAHVVHARWIVNRDYGDCTCSVCRTVYEDNGETIPDYWNYCPHCGAKMDKDMRGEQDE